MPGHISLATRAMGSMTSGSSGDAGLGTEPPIGVRTISGSARLCASQPRTNSIESPGKIRQLMTARALGGRALSALPPSIRVATQVVRRTLL